MPSNDALTQWKCYKFQINRLYSFPQLTERKRKTDSEDGPFNHGDGKYGTTEGGSGGWWW